MRRIAQAHYVSVAPHNCDGPLKTVAGIHLAANIPNFLILETFQDYDVPWREKLTSGTPHVKDGYYDVPTGPGWGIEVNEADIAAHPENPDAKLNMFSATGNTGCAGESGLWQIFSETGSRALGG